MGAKWRVIGNRALLLQGRQGERANRVGRGAHPPSTHRAGTQSILNLIIVWVLLLAVLGIAKPLQVAASVQDVYRCPGATLAFPFSSGQVGWVYAEPQGISPDGMHAGIDVWPAAGVGAGVYSPLDGTVSNVQPSGRGFYIEGSSVSIYITHIGNRTVNAGSVVTQGQLLGYVEADDRHVHISVGAAGFRDSIRGGAQDPSRYFGANLNWANGVRELWGIPFGSLCTAPGSTDPQPPSSTPPSESHPIPTSLFSARYESTGLSTIRIGETVSVGVGITNTSGANWPRGTANPVNLSYHWQGSVPVWDGLRTDVSGLTPGAGMSVPLRLRGPDAPGRYTLVITAVQEGVAWFEHRGVVPLAFSVQVTGGSQPTPGPGPTPTPLPTPSPRTSYGIPVLLSPTDGASVRTEDPVSFAWSDTGAAEYRLEAWNDTGAGSLSVTVRGTSAQYALGSPGAWRWQVRSVGGDGRPGDAPRTRSLMVYSGPQPPPYPPSFPGQTVSHGGNSFISDDGRTWRFQGKDKVVSCSEGADGVVLYRDTDYRLGGGCLFTTSDISDLTPSTFNGFNSMRFAGSYVGRYQVLVYRQANFSDLCATYTQDQSDLRNCAGQVRSLEVRPYTPPPPIAAPPGVTLTGNIASRATLSASSATAAVDGSLSSEWLGGHKFTLTMTWSESVTIHRIVVWDRTQNSPDNSQINQLTVNFSDGSSIANIDMTSGGPRCADVRFAARTVTSVTLVPVDASGTNGLREVEIWATSGEQTSNNSCVMTYQR